MDENNPKPKVEYSEFRRMLEEMRGNKQNSAQDSNNELTNNIKDLVVVVKELTKNITEIIGGQRTAPMGKTPFTAANSNNPKIQSDELELENIKREEEQTELLRIIARNTGGKEKFKPEKSNEDVIGGGILKGLIMTGAAIVAFFKGYMTRFIKILSGTYQLFVPESLRRGISDSFARIGTFFSEMVGKIKALFVFDEASLIGKAINGIKTGFKSMGMAFEWIGEAVSKFGKFFDFLKIGKFAKFLKAVPIIGEVVAVVEALWYTVSGIFEGWDKGGLIGAITGGMKGFFGKFIGGTLDLIKDIGSWILGALGFTNLEKFLDSFSFEKAISGLIEGIMSPLQLLQDVIMHPIESLKKLGGVISDVFSKITKVFDPVIEFFSGIGKSVVGMLEGIGIPEIGFTIPIIGKKISIGPFYPFKSDAQKPVAPAAQKGAYDLPSTKTPPEAADTKLAPQPAKNYDLPAQKAAVADSAAKMPAGQVANVAAEKSKYRINLEQEFAARAKAAGGYAMAAGNGQNPDGTANEGMKAFMANEARMRELDGLIEKDDNARKTGKPAVPEVSKNKAPEKVSPSVVPASPAVATPVSAEPNVVFRRSKMTSETIGGQVITGYERGYQLHGKKEDVDQADNAYAAFRKASSNGDDAGAQAAAEEFIRLATMIKSPEYVAKMKEISAKQSGRAQAVATPSVVTPPPPVATPIKASPIVEAKTPAVATPIKAKTDTAEQTRMAARGMYQAGTKEEEAAKQKLEAFKAANPFDIKAKGEIEAGTYTPSKFSDSEKQKEYDALYDATYKASKKKEKAKTAYETSDNAQKYTITKRGNQLENTGASFAKLDALINRFGYKESDLLDKNGKDFDEYKIIREYDKNINKDLMSTATPKASPIVEKAATPIPGGGQTVNPSAQNYNAKAAGTETKAPEKASPIVEDGKYANLSIFEYNQRAVEEYKKGTPGFELLEDKETIKITNKDYLPKGAKYRTTKSKSIRSSSGGPIDDSAFKDPFFKNFEQRARGIPASSSSGSSIEAKTGDVANSRDALTTSGNAGTAIVNAPTTVNNSSQNTTIAKSPFRNEEGTINKYYSTRLGAY